jgi:hypothetical protein
MFPQKLHVPLTLKKNTTVMQVLFPCKNVITTEDPVSKEKDIAVQHLCCVVTKLEKG